MWTRKLAWLGGFAVAGALAAAPPAVATTVFTQTPESPYAGSGASPTATFLTGEMDADEAARTAEMLGLEIAVACHYLAKDAEVDRFLELMPKHDTTGRRQAVAPEVGQTLVVDGASWTLEEAAA